MGGEPHSPSKQINQVLFQMIDLVQLYVLQQNRVEKENIKEGHEKLFFFLLENRPQSCHFVFKLANTDPFILDVSVTPPTSTCSTTQPANVLHFKPLLILPPGNLLKQILRKLLIITQVFCIFDPRTKKNIHINVVFY